MSTDAFLQDIAPVTHDTYHLRFTPAEPLNAAPGQAVEMTLDRDGWRDEGRPFTPVSLADAPHVDFVIKTYPDRHGVTEQIATLRPGEKVTLGAPFGAFEDKGPGLIVAGGAGITPFLPMLQAHVRTHGSAEGFKLLFANRTEDDIILPETLTSMKGLDVTFLVTDEDAADHPRAEAAALTRDALERHVPEGVDTAYVCGPPEMVDAVSAHLKEMGISEGAIFDDGW